MLSHSQITQQALLSRPQAATIAQWDTVRWDLQKDNRYRLHAVAVLVIPRETQQPGSVQVEG